MGPSAWTLLLLAAASSAATAITNNNQPSPPDSATAEFTQINQFQPFSQQLTRNPGPQHPQHLPRSVLSPSQQSNILTDVQQHRFQISVPPEERPQNYQPQRQNNPAFPQYNNQFQQYDQLNTQNQQQFAQPSFQQSQKQQPHHQPQQNTQFAQPSFTQSQGILNTDYNFPSQSNFQAEAPRFQQPEATRFQQPEATRFPQSETNKFQRPESTRFQQPEATRFQQPEATRFQQSEATRFQQSEATRFQQSEATRFQQSEATRFQQPDTTGFQQQEIPRYQQPEVPRFQQAEAPKYQQPEVPRFQQSENPRFQSDFRQQPFDTNNYVSQDNRPSLNKLGPKQTQNFQYLSEEQKQSPFLPVVAAPSQNLLTTQKPTYILETQPPTPYRKQKPLEAITFSTESYHTPSTKAPPPTSRPVKHRRPSTKHEKQSKKEEKSQELYIKQDRQKLYQQIVSEPHSTTRAPRARPTKSTTPAPTAPTKSDQELIQEELQRQLQEQLGDSENPFKTLKITLPGALSADQIANLPQIAGLQDATISQDDPGTSFLPGGENFEIVQGPKGLSLPGKKKGPEIRIIHQPAAPTTTTTVKPPAVLFEELRKGVLPPGADFELIRQKQDGALEEVGKLQNLPQKKVTFVILEEQPDGSVKVQGVRGNENAPTGEGPDVDSIIDKIKKGEIKLPPSSKNAIKSTASPIRTVTPQESVASPSYVKHTSKTSLKATPSPKISNIVYESKRKSFYTTSSTTTTTEAPVFFPGEMANAHAGPIFALQADYRKTSTTTERPRRTSTEEFTSFLPTVVAIPEVRSPVPQYRPTARPTSRPTTRPTTTTTVPPPPPPPETPPTYINHRTSPTEAEHSSPASLHEIFKSHGLYAMARFLRQSGLDRILNETGPYTIFVPTDRAFRSLLVQLGGPDRAEQKFKQNPRLLSGLLLHHVIPGAFKLDSLQDEMTGVSLAGTQLRVNTYTTQDQEWNDLKVVTINGARILQEMSDIEVPQGVAHAVDRVMFPLPVGDVVQTLQADREGRFSKFIKLLEETGVAASLQGSKTYTVFAPTNEAFPSGEEERLLEQRAAARALVLRHLTPGTLYSAGMLYYQLRDTMNSGKQITLFKEAGRVKVNNAQVVTRNIPATNGVIHAVDSLL